MRVPNLCWPAHHFRRFPLIQSVLAANRKNALSNPSFMRAVRGATTRVPESRRASSPVASLLQRQGPSFAGIFSEPCHPVFSRPPQSVRHLVFGNAAANPLLTEGVGPQRMTLQEPNMQKVVEISNHTAIMLDEIGRGPADRIGL